MAEVFWVRYDDMNRFTAFELDTCVHTPLGNINVTHAGSKIKKELFTTRDCSGLPTKSEELDEGANDAFPETLPPTAGSVIEGLDASCGNAGDFAATVFFLDGCQNQLAYSTDVDSETLILKRYWDDGCTRVLATEDEVACGCTAEGEKGTKVVCKGLETNPLPSGFYVIDHGDLVLESYELNRCYSMRGLFHKYVIYDRTPTTVHNFTCGDAGCTQGCSETFHDFGAAESYRATTGMLLDFYPDLPKGCPHSDISAYLYFADGCEGGRRYVLNTTTTSVELYRYDDADCTAQNPTLVSSTRCGCSSQGDGRYTFVPCIIDLPGYLVRDGGATFRAFPLNTCFLENGTFWRYKTTDWTTVTIERLGDDCGPVVDTREGVQLAADEYFAEALPAHAAEERAGLGDLCPYDDRTLPTAYYKAGCVDGAAHRVDAGRRLLERVAYGSADCAGAGTVVSTTPCECNAGGAGSVFVVCANVAARRHEGGSYVRWVDANAFFTVRLNACVRSNGTWAVWRKYDIEAFVTRTAYRDGECTAADETAGVVAEACDGCVVQEAPGAVALLYGGAAGTCELDRAEGARVFYSGACRSGGRYVVAGSALELRRYADGGCATGEVVAASRACGCDEARGEVVACGADGGDGPALAGVFVTDHAWAVAAFETGRRYKTTDGAAVEYTTRDFVHLAETVCVGVTNTSAGTCTTGPVALGDNQRIVSRVPGNVGSAAVAPGGCGSPDEADAFLYVVDACVARVDGGSSRFARAADNCSVVLDVFDDAACEHRVERRDMHCRCAAVSDLGLPPAGGEAVRFGCNTTCRPSGAAAVAVLAAALLLLVL